jgi:hypothetical protein
MVEVEDRERAGCVTGVAAGIASGMGSDAGGG